MKLNDLWQVWPVKFHKSPQPGRVRGKTSMKLNDLWQVWPVKFHKSNFFSGIYLSCWVAIRI